MCELDRRFISRDGSESSMGITNLFKLVTFNMMTFRELSNELTYKLGRRPVMAIDGYVLMHRYGTQDAEFIVKNPERKPEKMVRGFLNFVKKVQDLGYDAYVVFDGNSMKIKSKTNEKRALLRKRALEEGKWEQAFSVTSVHMAYIIRDLEQLNVKYLVAPFEADPQLVYLEKSGLADVIYTVDSDVIAYGCKLAILGDDNTHINVYRSTLDNGEYVTVLSDIIPSDYSKQYLRRYRKTIDTFSVYQVQLIAILLGCDYFRGVYGIGPMRALPIASQAAIYFDSAREMRFEATVRKFCEKIPIVESLTKMVNKAVEKGESATTALKNIIEQMVNSIHVFNKQPVYDPTTERVVLFDDKLVTESDIEFFGEVHDEYIQRLIAKGKLNPKTALPFNLIE